MKGRQCVWGWGGCPLGPSVLRQREGSSSKQGVLHAGHSSVISKWVIVLWINYRNKKKLQVAQREITPFKNKCLFRGSARRALATNPDAGGSQSTGCEGWGGLAELSSNATATCLRALGNLLKRLASQVLGPHSGDVEDSGGLRGKPAQSRAASSAPHAG